MKLRIAGGLIAASVIATMSLTAAETEEKKIDLKEIKCVMNPNGATKLDKFVAYKGGKTFFCCGNCPKAFTAALKDDKKKTLVMAKANRQLFATKQATQEKCPFTGKALNKKQTTKIAGVEVAFCCGNCKGNAIQSAGEHQILMVFGEKAFKKGFKTPEDREKEKKEKKES